MANTLTSRFVCLYIIIMPSVAVSQTAELHPKESVVDYLKSRNEPSEFEARKTLFDTLLADGEYVGTAEQNRRLLSRLVSENDQASAAAQTASRQLAGLVKDKFPDDATVVDHFACPGWVPAAGFGINGSYGFTVRVRISDGLVKDQDFSVLVRSAFGGQGELHVSGTVKLYEKGQERAFASFDLDRPWFDTLGDGRTVARFPKKGTMIYLPRNTQVTAEIRVAPTVNTENGTVALWECTRRLVITEGV